MQPGCVTIYWSGDARGRSTLPKWAAGARSLCTSSLILPISLPRIGITAGVLPERGSETEAVRILLRGRGYMPRPFSLLRPTSNAPIMPAAEASQSNAGF
jgi:hypothetical protein